MDIHCGEPGREGQEGGASINLQVKSMTALTG